MTDLDSSSESEEILTENAPTTDCIVGENAFQLIVVETNPECKRNQSSMGLLVSQENFSWNYDESYANDNGMTASLTEVGRYGTDSEQTTSTVAGAMNENIEMTNDVAYDIQAAAERSQISSFLSNQNEIDCIPDSSSSNLQ